MPGLRSVTRRIRDLSPAPVLRLLRALVRLFGTATARWRMDPSFVIVGAQRAGTTSLFRALSGHPSVVRPTQAKGIGYFDLNYARGRRWYRGHFPLRVVARFAAQGTPFAFESSGYYLFHPAVPGRIAADLPGVKVVVMVREPVERAYSAHRHELARGFETEPFEQAVELEPSRTEGEAARLVADPSYESFEHRHHSYLARSRYSEQIQRYVDVLGADRVYVVDADRFFGEPEVELARLLAWLGLPQWRPETFEQWNARPKSGSLAPELMEKLRDHFAPYDEELARLMGRTPSWREDR